LGVKNGVLIVLVRLVDLVTEKPEPMIEGRDDNPWLAVGPETTCGCLGK
jgi:hypothetical protein